MNRSVLHTAGEISRIGSKILTALTAVVLILMILLSGYAVFDNWRIYNDASDSSLLQYKPHGKDGSSENFAELCRKNPDVVGWLSIDDTKIDYPVVQGRNNEEYLNKDALKNFSLSGSLFLDAGNDRQFRDPVSLIYGHHMDAEVMFGSIDLFQNQGYLEKHRSGILTTREQKVYTLDLFAFVSTDAYEPLIFDPSSSDPNALLSYIQEHASAYVSTETDGKRILELSTCSDAETNGRSVVFCTMEEKKDTGGKDE